jgi:hypothetical protein
MNQVCLPTKPTPNAYPNASVELFNLAAPSKNCTQNWSLIKVLHTSPAEVDGSMRPIIAHMLLVCQEETQNSG